MTDTGTQLLRAVLADPADDTVRLAYADWLDESGQPERAEFIRVGVKVARMASGCGAVLRQGCDGNKEWCLRCREVSRERELLATHEATWRRGRRCEVCLRGQVPTDHDDDTCPTCHGTGWLGSLAEEVPDDRAVYTGSDTWRWLVPAEWSRGFVSTVRVTLDQLTREWNGHPWAARLFAEWPVTRVVVTIPNPQSYLAHRDWPAGILEQLNDWNPVIEGIPEAALSDAVCRWGRAEAAKLKEGGA